MANDNFCPLQKVWAVIGNSNVRRYELIVLWLNLRECMLGKWYKNYILKMWANISEHERPHQLDWDLNKTGTWKPLFSKPVEDSKVSSVQPNEIM